MADHKDIFTFVVFCIYSVTAAIQLFYWLYFYLAINKRKQIEANKTKQPVSVIICARNEAENLQNFLPSVLEQDYPNFEVIIVNDCSEDNSYEVLGKLITKYPHLKISTIQKDPKFTRNKKFAQFIGIKAAKNEILVFTDADCRPLSDKWLQGMETHFDENTDFVLGYGGYLNAKGVLNKYIRYDCMTIAMQYLGMAIRGIPYMGVGRNLAYRRTVFFKNKGFGSHNHIISGDDDLMVNSLANSKNTKVEYREECHTRSVPCSGFSEWITQKKRHLTTAPYYKFRDKVLLITEPATRIIYYFSFALLISSLYKWPWVSAMFLIRIIYQFIIFHLAQKKLREPGLLYFLVLFDIFSPFINCIVYLSSKSTKPGINKWK